MGANEKVAATFHPGNQPLLPPSDIPARSGVHAVIGAADRVLEHSLNLQAAIDDIRALCDMRQTIGNGEIRNLLESHHV